MVDPVRPGKPREISDRLAGVSRIFEEDVTTMVGDVGAPDGDDSDVMVAPGNPEGSSDDAALPPAPWSRPAEPQPAEPSAPQAELPSEEIEPDERERFVRMAEQQERVESGE